MSGSSVTLRFAGTCTITATQAGQRELRCGNSVKHSRSRLVYGGWRRRSNSVEAVEVAAAVGWRRGNPLVVTPTSVTISAAAGGAPGTATVTLSYQTFTQGAPSYSSNFNTNQGQGWLSVSPASGTMTQARSTVCCTPTRPR